MAINDELPPIGRPLPQIAGQNVRTGLVRRADTNKAASLSGIPSLPDRGRVPVYRPERGEFDVGWPSPPGIFNLKPWSCPNWKMARARELSGGTIMHIGITGDSTSSTSNSTFSAMQMLFKLLTRDRRYGVTRTGYRSVVTGGTNLVTANSDAQALGANIPNAAATLPANGFTWTPTYPVDTFVIKYVISPPTGTNSFTPAIDGTPGSAQTTVGATGSVGTLVLPAGALGTHTLTVPQPSGNAVYFQSVNAYNSADGASLMATNVALAGRSASTWSADYNTVEMTHDFDLLFYNLGINNTQASIYQAAVSAAKFAATKNIDLILVGPAPFNDRWSDIKYDYLQRVALDFDLPMLDLRQRWSKLPAAVTTARGIGGHPDVIGQADVAYYYAWALAQIG